MELLAPLDVALHPLPLPLGPPEPSHTHLHTLNQAKNSNHLPEPELQQDVLGVESQLLFLLIAPVIQHSQQLWPHQRFPLHVLSIVLPAQ